MRIELIVVGRTVKSHFIEGIKDYVSRIEHYIPFSVTVISELKNTKKLTIEQQKIIEGELILKRFQTSSYVILLDERGKEYRSVDFARFIEIKQQSIKHLIFVIGGAYGFSDTVYNRANDKLSLSKMTFSHQMIRLIFIEQLYRALTIIKGEPYHHE